MQVTGAFFLWTVIVFLVGLTAGNWIEQSHIDREEAEPTEPEMVTVLCAAKDLPPGAHVKNQDCFQGKEFIKGHEPKNAVREFPEIEGQYLKTGLRRGELILHEDVWENPTELPVPKGHLPVVLRFVPPGGILIPGTRADIVWCHDTGKDDETRCVLLLENVLLLSCHLSTPREEFEHGVEIVVAVHPNLIRTVTAAMETGSLQLLVRKPGDNSTSD
jgi:Flp pilus assembly protein CpaB